MNLVGRLFGSSIGRKILMAVTGAILIAFVVGHLVGNLQVFQDPDHINGYAAFLHHLGPLLWVARIGLLVAVAIHIWAATVLTLENHAAREIKYSVKNTIRATLSSRLMRWTGVVVLAFIIFHLAQFTFGYAQADTFKTRLAPYTMTSEYRVGGFPVVAQGESVLDVRGMMIRGFQSLPVSIFYLVAIGLLSMHLLHGFDSMFQSVGLRSGRWSRGLRAASIAFCLLYFFFNATIPVSVLLGRLTVDGPPAAAAGR